MTLRLPPQLPYDEADELIDANVHFFENVLGRPRARPIGRELTNCGRYMIQLIHDYRSTEEDFVDEDGYIDWEYPSGKSMVVEFDNGD